jgi:hypothetical protein
MLEKKRSSILFYTQKNEGNYLKNDGMHRVVKF